MTSPRPPSSMMRFISRTSGIVEEGLVDEEHPVRGCGGVDQLAAVRRGEGERLLHPDVLARAQRRERHGVVPRRRRGDHDRVDVRARR